MPFPADPALDLDPLFFRGKSSVLGEPVDVRLAGALPTDFPAIGRPGAPPTAPTPPPTGTPPTQPLVGGLGPFPELHLPDFPDLPPFGGQFPQYLPGIQSPGQPFDWLGFLSGLGSEALNIGGRLGRLLSGLDQPTTEAQYLEGIGPYSIFGPGPQGGLTADQFSLYGEAETPPSLTGFGVGPTDLPPIDLQAPGGPTPAFTLTGEGAPTGGPSVTDLQYPGGTLWPGTQTGFTETGAGAGAGAGLSSALPYVVPGLETAGGAYQLATAKTPSQRVAGGAATAGGLIGLAGAAGLLAPAIAGPLGLAAALPSLYNLASAGWAALHDPGPTWPTGFLPISQDQPNAAIDPSTGRVMWYTGHGQYAWPSQTELGQQMGVPDIATPEALQAAGIFPSGPLLQDPAYRATVMQTLPTFKGAALPAEIQALPEVQAWQAQQQAQAPPGFTVPTPSGAPRPTEVITPAGVAPAPMPAGLQTSEQKANPPSYVPTPGPRPPLPTLPPAPGTSPTLDPLFLRQDPNMPAGWFIVPGAQDVYFPQYGGEGGGRS